MSDLSALSAILAIWATWIIATIITGCIIAATTDKTISSSCAPSAVVGNIHAVAGMLSAGILFLKFLAGYTIVAVIASICSLIFLNVT